MLEELLPQINNGNGLILWKNFTLDNELYQLIVENGTTKIINRFYNRADLTNLTGIVDGLVPANNEALTYTDAARLSGATSTGTYGSRSWTYDNNGNRLSETSGTTVNSYTYPATSNRLTNVKQGAVTTRAFTYDAAGNTTQDMRGTSAYKYAVNNAGRIKTLTIGTTLKATWTYDGFQKLRIKAATSPAATTHYVWDNFGHIIAEHSSTGTAQRQYIWLGDTPIAVFDGTNLYYVHTDHLDRPVAMTNSAAMTLAWSAKYDPFGNPVAVTTPADAYPRLPGQWYQLEDGLNYNWYRSYDPTLGRYNQADPLGFVDGPSVYTYAKSSPEMKVDADGRTASGPMSKPVKPNNPDGPKQCDWDDARKECHENCRWHVGFPGAIEKYWKCMNECLGIK